MFKGTSNNHDGIVEGALCLLEELFCTATQDNGARLSLRAAHEQVESVAGREEIDQLNEVCNSDTKYRLQTDTSKHKINDVNE